MSLPPQEIESAKIAGLSELAGVAIGVGIGMLIGGKFSRSMRQGAALGLLAAGVASSMPFLIRFLDQQINHDGSRRSMRNKLASIREDSGLQSESEMAAYSEFR